MTRLVVAQLAAGSPPGLLRPWARSRGIELDVIRVDLGESLPPVRNADGLVAIGSDASVRDEWLSWMGPTRAWVAEALAIDVPLLGIGLGAQLMASVLGADIEPAPEPEVGLIRVETAEPGIPSGPWVAYNEDTIVLPTAPWTNALNDLGPQAFRTGPHLGIQFHAQATPDMVRGWGRDGRFAVPGDLDIRVVDNIMSIAGNARALFSGWATHAGIDLGTEPMAIVAAR